jgi:hypothetical protein
MTKLHKVSDYDPHASDRTWYDTLPKYEGQILNPYQGTSNWSEYPHYAAALMYYKRVIEEWCEKRQLGISEFLKLDSPYNSKPSRILDKVFW